MESDGCSIKNLVPPSCKVHSLSAFLKSCFHHLVNVDADPRMKGNDLLMGTVIVPLPSWRHHPDVSSSPSTVLSQACEEARPIVNPYARRMTKVSNKPQKAESIESVVDHVVSTLVLQQEKQRKQAQAKKLVPASSSGSSRIGRNLLSLGYAVASSYHTKRGARSVRTMPGGVVQRQLNRSVDFIKTSDWGRQLHDLVGDDVLRALLLHTCIFIPIFSASTKDQQPNHNQLIETKQTRSNQPSSSSSFRGNYLQLAGPHLLTMASSSSVDNQSNGRKSRKRKRSSNASNTPTSPLVGFNPQLVIDRRGMFPAHQSQTYVPSPGLPSKHILNSATFTAEMLLANLTKLPRKTKAQRRRFQQISENEGLEICQSILRQHAGCDYHRLLKRYCNLPKFLVAKPETPPSLASVSAAFCPTNQVVSFVKSVVSHVFPQDCWGSEWNTTQVMNQIESFLMLRRQEQFPRRSLLKGIKVTKVTWLQNKKAKSSASDHQELERILLNVLKWLFEDFVIPLLGCCFHITDSETHSRRVLYYRKPTWTLFCSLSMQKVVHIKNQYKPISLSETSALVSEHEMGISRLRMVPKETGVRPIAMLSKAAVIQKCSSHQTRHANTVDEREPCANQEKRKRAKFVRLAEEREEADAALSRELTFKPSSNAALNDAFAVLRTQYQHENGLFGTGIPGLHLFYPRYRSFIERTGQRKRTTDKLLFASVDIQSCYDTINQDKLLEFVDQLLTDTAYMVQRVGVTYLARGSTNGAVQQNRSEVGPPGVFRSLWNVLPEMNKDLHDCIIRDLSGSAVIKKETIMNQLTEHLKSHIVVSKGRFNERFMLQQKGIPQGSVLSSLLCNMYYGSVVEKKLGISQSSCQPENPNLVCRMMDDYLMVSYDQTVVNNFLSIMCKGDKELGAEINKDKTQVSFNTSLDVKPDGTRRFFPWCGMLFDVSSGEVRIDYSRFHRGKARDGLNVDCSSNEGVRFDSQLKFYVRPRCLPILFDSAINSSSVQRINFYQLIVMTAVKMAFHLDTCKRLGFELTNNSFLLSCVKSTIEFARGLVLSRLSQYNARSDIALDSEICQWLGWRAVCDVFARLRRFQGFYNAANGHIMELEKDAAQLKIFAPVVQQALREMNPILLLMEEKNK